MQETPASGEDTIVLTALRRIAHQELTLAGAAEQPPSYYLAKMTLLALFVLVTAKASSAALADPGLLPSFWLS